MFSRLRILIGTFLGQTWYAAARVFLAEIAREIVADIVEESASIDQGVAELADVLRAMYTQQGEHQKQLLRAIQERPVTVQMAQHSQQAVVLSGPSDGRSRVQMNKMNTPGLTPKRQSVWDWLEAHPEQRDLPQREIASRLGVSVGLVNSVVHLFNEQE